MEKLKISIIVPIYKVEKELPRCLKSILAQTYKEIEIILVDDGSPDSCPQMCDEYAKKYANIKVIHKPNGGLSDARNVGLKIASGSYVMYVDSDDYIEATACTTFALVAGQYKPDIIVGEAVQAKKKKVTKMSHSNLEENRVYSAHEYVAITAPKGEWYAPAWLNLYRKDFLMENKLFFVKGLLHEDMEMLPRLFLAANSVMYCKGCFYNYVIRDGSIMQQRKNSKNKEDIKTIYAEWKHAFDQIEDKKLQQITHAFLCRCYLNTCRIYKITETYVEGITKLFILKKSRGVLGRIKALAYVLFPYLYVQM